MYVAISYPNIRFILETYTYLIHTFYLKSITSHYFRGEKLYTIIHVHAGILISHTRSSVLWFKLFLQQINSVLKKISYMYLLKNFLVLGVRIEKYNSPPVVSEHGVVKSQGNGWRGVIGTFETFLEGRHISCYNFDFYKTWQHILNKGLR